MKGCIFLATRRLKRPIDSVHRALAHALAENGYLVVLLIYSPYQIQEIPNDNPAVFNWPSQNPNHFRDALFLIKLIKKYHPICFISHWGAVNIMTLVGWMMGVPVRIAWHETGIGMHMLEAPKAKWLWKFFLYRKAMIYRFCTQLVSVSNDIRDELGEYYRVSEDKCKVIYNSIPDPLLLDTSLRKVKKQNYIVCVGRMTESKGQEILLSAVKKLKQNSFPVQVIIIGEGSQEVKLKQLACDYGIDSFCQFLGPLPNSEVLQKMAAAAITVVPTKVGEAFGVVNIESMSLGTPIIASRVGGIPEIIRDGVDGILIKPEDPNALAEKLELLLNNNCLRESMGQNARNRFLILFEEKSNINMQVMWLDSLLIEYINHKENN